MTEIKEKISLPFVFLNISATTFAAHCQSAQAKACQGYATDRRKLTRTHLNIKYLENNFAYIQQRYDY